MNHRGQWFCVAVLRNWIRIPSELSNSAKLTKQWKYKSVSNYGVRKILVSYCGDYDKLHCDIHIFLLAPTLSWFESSAAGSWALHRCSRGQNSECRSERCQCSPISCSDPIENVTRVSFCHPRFSNRQLNWERTWCGVHTVQCFVLFCPMRFNVWVLHFTSQWVVLQTLALVFSVWLTVTAMPHKKGVFLVLSQVLACGIIITTERFL